MFIEKAAQPPRFCTSLSPLAGRGSGRGVRTLGIGCFPRTRRVGLLPPTLSSKGGEGASLETVVIRCAPTAVLVAKGVASWKAGGIFAQD